MPLTEYYGLDWEWYLKLPDEYRTYDCRNADYALITNVRREKRDDYSGPAHNTITELYLVGRDGSNALVCSITHTPPIFGEVTLGQSLGGRVATIAELWEKINDLF